MFVLFKVYWDWIQFKFKVPLLWEGKRGLSLTQESQSRGLLLCPAPCCPRQQCGLFSFAKYTEVWSYNLREGFGSKLLEYLVLIQAYKKGKLES